MVYTGKPSKACGRCRERRIKCDFGRPDCRKCQNAGVECPGYRNEQDLLFKNVTGQIIERQTVANSKVIKSNGSHATAPRTTDRHAHTHHSTMAVAITFLFECYLQGSSFLWAQGLYQEVESTSLFAQVVEATALAVYSYESHRQRLLAQSRIAYESTLIRLREVLASTAPISNSTLASILLMSRFETLLADGTETIVTDSWTGHIAGAFSVVSSRSDADNFGDELSFRLAEQTVHNYNMWCLRARKLRSEPLVTMANKIHQRLGFAEDTALRRLRIEQQALSAALVECRKVLLTADIKSIRAAIAYAGVLDKQAEDFCNTMMKTVEASFEVRPVAELERLYGKIDIETHSPKYHHYKNHHAARLWNNIRMMVVTTSFNLMETAQRVQAQNSEPDNVDLASELEVVVSRCKQVMATMCDQICDSAPQFLCPGTSYCTHAAASYLGWPLFVAARPFVNGGSRFAQDALLWLGEEFNIKSAAQAGQKAQTQPEDFDDWLLACYMF